MNKIPEAAVDAVFDSQPYGTAPVISKLDIEGLLRVAAPHLMAELADSREGELFRFTWAQREWLRNGGTK